MRKPVYSLILLIVIILISTGCAKENNLEPVAGKFNAYIGKLAANNQEFIIKSNKLHSARNAKLEDKLALLDSSINELNKSKKIIQNKQAPSELDDLKIMYLSLVNSQLEYYQLEKETLPKGADANQEEEELADSKVFTASAQIESFITSIEDGYHIKALNRESIIQLKPIKNNKYFIDLK